MQAGSGGHIGRVEKQLGLNLQVSGGRLRLYRDLGSGHKVSPGWGRRKLGGPPNFFRPIRGATKFFWNH